MKEDNTTPADPVTADDIRFFCPKKMKNFVCALAEFAAERDIRNGTVPTEIFEDYKGSD